MSQELHYTSAPRGLKPGSRGFCTVAATPGLSGTLLERLESLSAYQPVYPVHDPAAARNPVNFMHLKPALGGKSLSILSRVGPAGLDYSGRTNKYGHHIVLEANERPAGGPAWLLSQPGFVQDAWHGEPRLLAHGTRPPQGDPPPEVARAWQAVTGDAGWAGVLAEAFLADPRRAAVVVFQPGLELLPLFVEAIALLPLSERWDVEFSTFFATLPPGVTCSWRGVIDGSPEAEAALRLPGALVIDLCRPNHRASGGALVQAARTGERPEVSGAADESSRVNPPGRRVPPVTSPSAAPPSRTPSGLPGVTAQPPSLQTARRASHKTSRTWVVATAAAALCMAGIVATAVFILQNGSPNVAKDDARSQPAKLPSRLKETIAVVPGAVKQGQADDKPEKLTKPEIASAAAPAPTVTAAPKNGSAKEGRGGPAEYVLVGPPRDPIPGDAGEPPAHPEKPNAPSKPAPATDRNVVLELILPEKGKESVLELPQSAAGSDPVRKLELTILKKPAKPFGESVQAKPGSSDQTVLDVMATLEGALGTKEQAIAHFKADGRKITFNWDKAATDALADEAKELLGASILKIVTDHDGVRYALLWRRGRPASLPVKIPAQSSTPPAAGRSRT